MNKCWLFSDGIYNQVGSNQNRSESLPVGVYNVGLSLNGFYLKKFADNFAFPYKIYGLEDEFIDHVVKTYNSTTGNFGVLLTGTKGTGKSVTAKLLANKLQLPVIIFKDMGENTQNEIEFLSGIENDCIIFLDEFEKNFDEQDSTILQITDGAYNTNYRKVFLLTTNTMEINENLIGRPSRIRYVKKFGNLSLKMVNEYLDDVLKVPEARQDLLDYIDRLTISTIDILKTIVEEVNIHGVDGLKKAKDFFNVVCDEYTYHCVKCHAYEKEIKDNPELFSVENFVKAVERNNNPIPKPLIADESNCSPEERKALNEYYEYNRHEFHNLSNGCVVSEVKFSNLKQGCSFNEEEVIYVNKELNVILTKYNNYIKFYWISDPDSAPSLYHRKTFSKLWN